MDLWMLNDPESDAIAREGYARLFSPDGVAHIGYTITNLFELMNQAAEEIEELKARVKRLEATIPPPPAATE